MKTGMMITTAIASLFATAALADTTTMTSTTTAAPAGMVHCSGISTNSCKTANNACKGMEIMTVSKEECMKKGGKVVE